MESQAQTSSSEAEIAAVIASILAETLAVPSPAQAVAAILLTIAPAPLLAQSEQAASVTFGLGSLIVQTPVKSMRRAGIASEGQFWRETALKGFYALAALKRVAEAEDKAKALKREPRFFAQQLEASRQRMAGAALNDAAAERYGDVLSWNHTGRSKTHRPSHKAADGANYRVSRPPTKTGGFPATLPGCDCLPGPPISGARMLT